MCVFVRVLYRQNVKYFQFSCLLICCIWCGRHSDMAGDKDCRICFQRIDPTTDLFAVCGGDCNCFFHGKCANLSENDVMALKGNIIWLCDNCIYTFRKARNDRKNKETTRSNPIAETVNGEASEKSLDAEVRELKIRVAEIANTMSKLVPSNTTVDPPVMHSTPVSSSKLLDGTNVWDSARNNDEGLWQCKTDNRNFSLLLTNIDTTVDECDVRRLVARALDANTVDPEYFDVTKLVPRWKSRDEIDFLSFKVILDSRFRDKAMNPSTWPKDIKFREFIKKRRNTWKPL